MERLNVKEREEVQERYPEVKFPDPVLEPLWFGKRPTTRIDGKKAIIDQTTENVFGICSDLYQVIHYEDILKMVETTVKNLPEFGNISIFPRLVNEGSKMVIKAKFEDVHYEIKKGDVINPEIMIRTSYDLMWKLSAVFGAFRLICSNGMTIGKVFSKFAKRHIVSLDPSSLTESIQGGMGAYSEQVGLWQKWAELKLNKDVYDSLWEALPFSPTEKEKIEKLPETSTNLKLEDKMFRNEATLWDLHSIVTQYATHNIASEVRKADVEPLIARAFDMGFAKLQ
jgi:hypothetical protein